MRNTVMVGILDGASDTVGVLLGLVGTTTGFTPPPTIVVVVGKLDGASDGIVVIDGLAVGGDHNKETVGDSDGASEGDKEGSADDDATRVFAAAADDNGDDPRMVDGVMDGCCGTASAQEAAL
jgi:hypothetical protein